MKYLHSLQSEWLKTKRSAASWLCIIGGFFVPVINLIYFLVKKITITNKMTQGHNWENHFYNLMHNMEAFLLPMGVILASSLITQMEYKNNTWKQLHTTPQSYTTIFFAKFSVIAIMTFKFFLFFNIGILLSGVIPCLIYETLPNESFPFVLLLKANIKIFILCMPIVAIQYLISLHFKNFLVPVGIGLVGLIGTIIGGTWEYIFISPFSYTVMDFMHVPTSFNLYGRAILCFGIIMLISYFLYLRKKEKG